MTPRHDPDCRYLPPRLPTCSCGLLELRQLAAQVPHLLTRVEELEAQLKPCDPANDPWPDPCGDCSRCLAEEVNKTIEECASLVRHRIIDRHEERYDVLNEMAEEMLKLKREPAAHHTCEPEVTPGKCPACEGRYFGTHDCRSCGGTGRA